ncbi:MAG: tRNA (N(6)-L-threonylcarbamoyladenosine(37)-C(2))-methylthiotransferase MtaB [Bacteroidia bacterium]|nr:tRNA (N(6)-L-threonylcarbamoyladenosine(37)-C(2))-methylthiotransferase MtaB [Bacteroidia bacterium]
MDKRLKVAFYTLGCKLNFSETSTIKRFFDETEYEKVSFDSPADIYVINTCSVTAAADKKCRHAIYKATSLSPSALVIVTGCFAQLQAGQIAKIRGVDIVLGEQEKFNIMNYLEDKQKRNIPEIHSCAIEDVTHFFPSWSIGDRVRSFLKVQDGCDYHCTYCTIPKARGKSRNAPVQEIVSEARKIAGTGIREIVLSGVNIGDFGKSTGESFFDLIRELDRVDGIERFRISSIEPNLLSIDMIQFIAKSKRVAPHLHIPLQSGSDHILGLMQRRYSTAHFAELISNIKANIPDACIGVDVITGFPSESENDFQTGYDFIDQLGISYLHVFSYSARPDTKAVEITDRISPLEINRRSKLLHQLSDKKRVSFYQDNIGKTAVVLPENQHKDKMMTGFTANYIKVEIPFDQGLINQPVKVVLQGINEDGNVTGILQ